MFSVKELYNVSFPHYSIVSVLTLTNGWNILFKTHLMLLFSKKKKTEKRELGDEGKKGYYLLGLRGKYACVQFARVI